MSAPRILSHLRITGAAAALSALAALSTAYAVGAAPASAATHIGATTGVRVAAVSPTGFTVTLNRTAYATHYRLFESTTRSDVYVADIVGGTSRAHTVTSTTARIAASGLKYTTAPIYYRVESYRSATSRSWSDILSVGLQPATVTGLKAHTGSGGTYLTWSAGAATGFAIAQATNAAGTANRVNLATRDTLHQFTPYHLARNTTYYFWVRAVNDGTYGHYAAHVTAKAATNAKRVSVMTYNVLEDTFDGTQESGSTVAPWMTQRLPQAVKLIKAGGPDVLAVQEAAAWTNGVKSPRQIDSIEAALRSTYSLARTEVPPTESGYFRTGNYIMYRTSTYKTYGAGGHWTLPYSTWAAYQVLQNRSTGAKFLAISVHLTSTNGGTYDTRRETETKALIADVAKITARYHVPVIYAGDYNTDIGPNHSFDGPGLAMRAIQAADAFTTAQHRTNAQYNSANQYLRTPPASGASIDHVYAPPGVAIDSWALQLSLSHGKFVGAIPSDHNPVVVVLSYPY